MAWDAPTEDGVYGPDTPWRGTVKSAEFKTDPRYNNGETLLLEWVTETDSDDPEFEEFTVTFPCGNNWETNDGGATAERVDGKRPKFNSNSGYGRVLNRVTGRDADLADNFKGILDVLENRGEPTNAKIWEGLTFVFDEESKDFGGEIGVKTRLMPVEFAGEAKGSSGGSGGKKGSSGGGKKPSKAAVRKKVVALAQEHDDHDEFVAETLDIDGIDNFDDLLESVNDPDGIFAENQ